MRNGAHVTAIISSREYVFIYKPLPKQAFPLAKKVQISCIMMSAP
jgi:hypothetical protein